MSDDALRGDLESTRPDAWGSPEILAAVFHNMSDGVVVADKTGRLVHFNRAAEAMIGIGRTDAPLAEWSARYGCYLADTVTPFPPEQLPLARALRGEEVSEAEVFVQHAARPQGLWISVNARPLRDATGAPRGAVAVLRDVTAHKHLEQERARLLQQEQSTHRDLQSALRSLRGSEARLRRLDESDLIGVIVADIHGGISEANDAFLQMIGYTREDLQAGRVRWDMITPLEYHDLDLRAVERLQTAATVPPWEKEYVRKDGSRIWVLVGVARLENTADSCICFVLDISQRKQVERRLAVKNAVTQVLASANTIAEAIPQVLKTIGESIGWDMGVIWNVDAEQGLLRCVETWSRSTAGLAEFVTVTRQFTFRAGVGLPGRVWASGQPEWIEDVVTDANFPRAPWAGRAGVHAGFGFPIRAGNMITGVIEFFLRESWPRDEQLLTAVGALGNQVGQFIARKQTEAELAASRERFDLAVQGSGDGIWDWDLESNRIYFSPRWKSMLGYADHELPNRIEEWRERIHPEDRERALATLREYLACERREYELEYRLRHKDGSYRWVLARGLAQRAADGRPYRMAGSHTDITTRKEAVEALRLNEERTRRILETANDAYVAIDADGRITDWNRQAEQIFGWPRTEAIGQLLTDTIIPVRYHADHERGLRHFLATGHGPILNQRIELTARHRDGHEFPVELTVWPSRVGAAWVLNAFVHDITERKQSEARLAEETNRLQILMDNVPDCIFVKDARSRFLASNPAHRVMLGAASLTDVLGKTDLDFFPPELAERFLADEQAICRHGQPMVNQLERVPTHAGGEKWMLTSKVPLRDQSGAVIGLVGICRDITSLKQAEERLREAQALYQSLVNSLPIQVFRKDTEERFTFGNPLFSEALGLAAHEYLGKTDWELGIPQAEAYHRQDRQVLDAGATFEDVQPHWKPSGEKAYYQVVKVPVHDSAGRIVGLQGICWDVTARKLAEETLVQARDAAEAASRAKSEFLASVSHEIRTPMHAIINATELVLAMNISKEAREFLGMVRSSAESLLAVINDILDFSKIEAGRMDLERAPFRLREVLDSAVDPLALRAHQKGLELVCHLAADVPEVIEGDRGRLRQVLVNLLDNAVKFTEEGEVVIEVSKNEERTPGPGFDPRTSTSLHFVVRDTGPGIAADKRGLIFQPFTQADGSVTKKHGGTGLGLAISRRLVGMMQGRVWLDSEPGRGCAFHFTACFGLSANAEMRPVPALPPGLAGMPVLVVDDNASSRRVLEETLRAWRFQPTIAVGAHAALDALCAGARTGRPFPLVVFDGQMPEMDGPELATQIEQLSDAARPSMVMLRSSRERSEAAVDRRSSTLVYLNKPVKPADLSRAILMALGCADSADETTRSPTSEKAAPARALRILLTEDNLFNQKLAVRLLESQGHEVVVAGNGLEAIAALERETFDLVLMDVQMPEMDGLEATARIRAREQLLGRRVPIVAMTAYAMKGDRERCLAAGMDAYVSKPVRAQELFDVIAELTGAASREERRPSAPSSGGTLDWTIALEYVNGDEDLLRALARMFLVEGPHWSNELRQALAAGDLVKARRLAHNLKSSAGHFAATTAAEAALRVEKLAGEGDLAGALAACPTMEREMAQLRQALLALPALLPVPTST